MTGTNFSSGWSVSTGSSRSACLRRSIRKSLGRAARVPIEVKLAPHRISGHGYTFFVGILTTDYPRLLAISQQARRRRAADTALESLVARNPSFVASGQQKRALAVSLQKPRETCA
jgi:hypothetical protein